MSWKDNIRKAEKLNSYDETNAFAMVLVEMAVLSNISDVLRFYEKPYKYQDMYEKMLKIVEEHYGEPASITEIIDVPEIAKKVEEYLYGKFR
jgi:hypothetical protein